MPTLATISPAKGTPMGGQSVTATGTWTAITGTVTVGGISVPATFTANSVTFATPPHRDAEGKLIAGGGIVAVAVSPTAQAIHTGNYEYSATLIEKALNVVRLRVAQRSKADGDFFDIGPAQVASFKTDQTADTGAEWPQVIVFQSTTGYQEDGQDVPYGFFTGKTPCVVQAAMPLDPMDDWTIELGWLVADLYRSVMLARNDLSVANDVRIDSSYFDRVTDPQAGAIGVAVVEFTVEVKHVHNDMTTNTEYTP